MRLVFLMYLWLGYVALGYAHPTSNQETVKYSYVWATHLNLRESPNAEAKVIAKLPYGTAVEIISSATNSVPYQMLYMNSYDNQSKMVQLTGYWQKVSALEHTGYVFSGLLLDIEPRKEQEYIISYLLRVFALKPQDKTQTREKIEQGEDKYTLITTKQSYISKDSKITLTLIETNTDPVGKEWPGSGGKVRIDNMPFEQAMVFFNHLLPPYMEDNFPSYTYKEGYYSYSIDGPGNSATLEKSQTGIIFSWFDGGD